MSTGQHEKVDLNFAAAAGCVGDVTVIDLDEDVDATSSI